MEKQWFPIRKSVSQGCILSALLFNLYAEHIMWNAGLDSDEGGAKIDGKNISNLRYADDTVILGKSNEDLKQLLMKLKENNVKAAEH